MKKKILICFIVLFSLLFVACTKKEYTIKYVTNNGTTIVDKIIEDGSIIDDLPILAKTGYEFQGWYTDEEGKIKYDGKAVSQDTTLYAKWKILAFKVTFMNGTEVVKEETVEYDKSATAPIVTSTGKEFRAWDKNYTRVTQDLVVNAIFDTSVYKVSFYYDNELLEEQDVVYGGEAVAPEITLGEGYKFDGWDTEFNNVKKDLVVTALTSKIKYSVKFFNEGVQIGPTQNIEHGSEAIAPMTPEKLGYAFVRWDNEFENVTSDLIINAVFERDTFEVKFFIDGIQVGNTQKVKVGQTATSPVEPTKTGYTFNGWDRPLTGIVGDTEINALFIKNIYVVKFMVNNEQLGEIQTIEYGESAVEPVIPELEGFIFVEWDKKFAQVTENLVINAVFEVLQLTVEFYDGSTLIEDGQSIEYGDDAVAPEMQDKEGYTFTGWDKEYTNVKSRLSVYAVWTLNKYSINYFDNDNKAVIDNEVSEFTIEDEIDLPFGVKESYIFGGWHKLSDLSDEAIYVINKGTINDLNLYAHWVEVDFNGGASTWVSKNFDEVNTASKGISAISDLPIIFAQDFYKYLKDNNLLTSSLVPTILQAPTWSSFMALNPTNGGDPNRIWCGTSNSYSSGDPGYVANFLYDSAKGDATTNELIDIQGGFLGTEPYKTKYWFFSQHLALLQAEKYDTNSFFSSSVTNRALTGFLIDGYFYGTQSVGTGNFAALRKVIPGTDFGYKFSGSTLVKVYKDYINTTSNEFLTFIAVPVKKDYVFDGWYYINNEQQIDVTSLAGLPNQIKLYAKWSTLQ